MSSSNPSCLSDDAIQTICILQDDFTVVNMIVELDTETLLRLKKSPSPKVVWLACVELDKRKIEPCRPEDASQWVAITARYVSAAAHRRYYATKKANA